MSPQGSVVRTSGEPHAMGGEGGDDRSTQLIVQVPSSCFSGLTIKFHLGERTMALPSLSEPRSHPTVAVASSLAPMRERRTLKFSTNSCDIPGWLWPCYS